MRTWSQFLRSYISVAVTGTSLILAVAYLQQRRDIAGRLRDTWNQWTGNKIVIHIEKSRPRKEGNQDASRLSTTDQNASTNPTRPNATSNRPSGNPHEEAYQAAKQAYADFLKKEKELQSRFSNTTGPERMECADKLRAMRTSARGIINTYKTAKRKYDTWNQMHAN